MKTFWINFAFYILTISLLPCTDTADCNDHNLVAEIDNSNHQKDSNNTEQCSPFCICSCCGITTVQLQIPLLTFTNHIYFAKVKQTIFYQLYTPTNNYNNIWQPPKVG